MKKTLYKKFLTDVFYSAIEMSHMRHHIEVENSRAKRGIRPRYPEGLCKTFVVEIEEQDDKH